MRNMKFNVIITTKREYYEGVKSFEGSRYLVGNRTGVLVD